MDSMAFLERLRADGHLTPAATQRAAQASTRTGTPIEKTLLEFGLMSEETLFREIAEFLDMPYLEAEDIDPKLLRSLPLTHDFLKRSEIVPGREEGETLVLASANPRGAETVRSIGYYLRMRVEMAIAAPSTVTACLVQAQGAVQPAEEGASDHDIDRLNQLANDGPVIKFVNDIIAQAVMEGASDVHVESGEDAMRVRYRIDGILQARAIVPTAMRAAAVSRLKVMAHLNISEKRRPQDGRAQLSVRGRTVDIRISSLPTQFGESVVLRLLDRTRLALDWDRLGYAPEVTRRIRRIIHRPNGIFLVAGPTGSGKTTTLYTALAELNVPERKIVTVEDPIEYALDQVIQVQVDTAVNMGFSEALRAILRQDPNVIMIGEIRDEETAEIAVRAALVGRMVLSTIHTNDSVSAIPRLFDLGVPPYLLGTTLRGVLSQRLVRTLCTACQGVGCEACDRKGYAGRTVLSELLEIDEALSQAICCGNATADLERHARAGGFSGMQETAKDLLRAGQVDQAEILRSLGAID